jgi:hypothetical protein
MDGLARTFLNHGSHPIRIAGNHYAIHGRAYTQAGLLFLIRRHATSRMRIAMGAESLSDH